MWEFNVRTVWKWKKTEEDIITKSLCLRDVVVLHNFSSEQDSHSEVSLIFEDGASNMQLSACKWKFFYLFNLTQERWHLNKSWWRAEMTKSYYHKMPHLNCNNREDLYCGTVYQYIFSTSAIKLSRHQQWLQHTHAAKQHGLQINTEHIESSFITIKVPPKPQPWHIPLTLSLQGLLGVLLGEGEAERLRRLLTLSQMHPPCLAPQVVMLTSRSILPTKLWARSLEQMESRVVGSERGGYSSSCGRTRQCKDDRQLPGPKPPLPAGAAPPPPPPPSQLSSSEGADRKVVQNIIVAPDWTWASEQKLKWRQQRKIPVHTKDLNADLWLRNVWRQTDLSYSFPVEKEMCNKFFWKYQIPGVFIPKKERPLPRNNLVSR